MKKILLSTDGPISVYEVPDKIAKDLHNYCLKFLDWQERGPKREWFRKNPYYPEAEFIDYLNTVVNPNYLEKSRFVKTLEAFAYDIPEEYRKLPYFNF